MNTTLKATVNWFKYLKHVLHQTHLALLIGGRVKDYGCDHD